MTGRKNALANRALRRWQITRSAISANATTSARRITGGVRPYCQARLACRPCLSPCVVGRLWPLVAFRLPWRFRAAACRYCRLAACRPCPSAARSWEGHATGFSSGIRKNGGCRRGSLHDPGDLPAQPQPSPKVPSRKRDVGLVDSIASPASCREPCRPGRVDRARASRDAHRTGAHHGTDTRRQLVCAQAARWSLARP